jgi:putative transposase
MSYISIWLNCVWTTKDRVHTLKDQTMTKVISHIRENAKSKGIYIDHINGFENHLHAIISMTGTQNASDLMQKIKGESSYWINKNRLIRSRFEWQDDFYLVSIGMSQLDNLREYIRNQVQHHQNLSLQEELDKLIAEYKLERIRD